MTNKKNKIEKIPDFPEELIDAILNKRLAIFIGAGISRLKPINCLGWEELGQKLLNQLHTDKKISYVDFETYKQTRDSIELITLCDALDKSNNKETFYTTFNEALKNNEDFSTKQTIYDELAKINALFVTTNADKHVDKVIHKKGNYQIKNTLDYFEKNTVELNDNFLYKIHGCISDRGGLIFKSSDYLRRYSNGNFINFLEKLFNEKTILFIGYGLKEFSLLLSLYQTKESCGTKNIRRYLLKGYLDHQENLYQNEKEQYEKDFGINILKFSLNEYGYETTHEVIKNLLETYQNGKIKSENEEIAKHIQSQEEFLQGIA